MVGPNDLNATSTSYGTAGDEDLDALAAQSCPPDAEPGACKTWDAVVLEFDFTSVGDTITLRYVLTSDEYNEWSNTRFNNIFAFFLDGANIALLPDGTTEVAINNVNGGNALNCFDYEDNNGDGYTDSYDLNCQTSGDNIVGEDPQNPDFFINNCGDPTLEESCPCILSGSCPLDIEADGLTRVLTMRATVTPGEHHLKLAVADAGDSNLDSWIFIESASFTNTEGCVGGDSDGDGVCDSAPDNCIDIYNPPPEPGAPQTDTDGDGLGDACDGSVNAVNAIAVPDVGSGIKECCVSFDGASEQNPIYTINPELFVRIQYKNVMDIWKDLNNHRDPAVHIIENDDGTWGGDVITITNSDPICVNIPDADFAELEKLGAVAVRCKFENLVKDPDDPNPVGEDPPSIVPLLRYTAIYSEIVTLNEWVRIDLKPGSFDNPINCQSKGKTPLVIYGAQGFNACNLPPAKISLNGASVALKKDLSYMAHCTDEDEDGWLDLFLHFYTQEIKLHAGNQTVHLTGQIDADKTFAAKDAVSPLNCPVEME